MKNLLTLVEDMYRNNLFKAKGKILRCYLILHGCRVGHSLRCHTFPRFRISPSHNINIGNRVTIGYDITFEIQESGFLKLGDNVKITQDVLISSGLYVDIGSNTIIGERVSIRDGEHGTSSLEVITRQKNSYSRVFIGKDVWIGAGSFILKGSSIPDGVLIGANSVVLPKSTFIPYSIYAGSPVKYLKERGA